MAKTYVRKNNNIVQIRRITSLYSKSTVKASYGIITVALTILISWGVVQLYRQELVQQQQEINTEAVGVDALLATTLNVDLALEQMNNFASRLGSKNTLILTSSGQILSHFSLQPKSTKSIVNIDNFIKYDFSNTETLNIFNTQSYSQLVRVGSNSQVHTNGYLITYQRLNNAPWLIVNITSVNTLIQNIVTKHLPIILVFIVSIICLIFININIINKVFEQLNQANIAAELANKKLSYALTELESLTSTDKLTGIWNRHDFEIIASANTNRILRHNESLSLLILKIDYFQVINDKYGDQISDNLIAIIASFIKENIRTSDLLARWSYEEFAILAPLTSILGAVELAERLRLVITNQNFPDVGNITVSFGVAQFQNGENLNNCSKRADKALYHSKISGRNTVTMAPRQYSPIQ
ncbi:putative GGDEF family protein [Calothrix sp. NIES-4071]|nr:putative GGDEF family protein [Calothrix sp. NIES-4071]BAZ61939.1 putative GGDEF family protein [Calothrix sp. NIES-4105]